MPATPPAFVTLDRLSYATPEGRPLFTGLTLAFGPERTGLVGRNGVGKTTLLKLILDELQPASGAVSLRGRIGVLRQTLEPESGTTLADLLGVAEALGRLDRIEAGEGDEQDLAEADWTLGSRLDAALARMGLHGIEPDRPAATLSGGQRTRAALAALLVHDHDLILLDEPTNNLDLEARGQVADFLRDWDKGALVVSHDRALLGEMDRIVELSGLGAKVYGGAYDHYAARKAEEEAALRRELSDAEREASRVARETQTARERKARRDSAGRRFAARGSEPRILLGAMAERAENSGARANLLAQRQAEDAAEQLEVARSKVERVRRLDFELPPSGLAAGKTVLRLDDVGVSYGSRTVLSGLSLQIVGPERVAVRGPNGAGKTTLLRIAAGDLDPSSGAVRCSGGSAFLDQQTSVLGHGETLVEAFRRLNPTASENAARAALARFLFRNVAADSRVETLSGGERLRAALAGVLMADRPPQLLILDEPTNHLDLESLTAVESALAAYDGALLLVSHDEAFLEAVGVTRTISLCG